MTVKLEKFGHGWNILRNNRLNYRTPQEMYHFKEVAA